jgi:TolB protein
MTPTHTPGAADRAASTTAVTPAAVSASATAGTSAPTDTSVPPTVTPSAAASPTASPVPSRTRPTARAASPQPQKAALSGRIFFPVYDAQAARRTFDIYSVRLDSGKRELVAGQASQPAISPDGRRLAYRSWETGQQGLSVLELVDGHAWRWIDSADAARPSWSPDSQNLVFPSQQEADRRWRIYRTTGLEFAQIRRYGNDMLGRVPIWLADGRIVYWDCPLADCGLYVMRGDGADPVRLTTAEHDTGPAASPDGQQVAFMSNRSENWDIYVIDIRAPSGAEPRRLTENAARDGLPTWSPDGKWLAFVSDRGGTWAVWAMRSDGSNVQKLFDLGGAPEGKVVYAQANEQADWTAETIAWGP